MLYVPHVHQAELDLNACNSSVLSFQEHTLVSNHEDTEATPKMLDHVVDTSVTSVGCSITFLFLRFFSGEL